MLLWTRTLALLLPLLQIPPPPDAAEEPPLTIEIAAVVPVDEEAYEWNWGAWDQDKIATFGHHQYTVYWAKDRSLAVARRDLRTNEVSRVHLPQHRLAKNDRHRNTCLGFSAADGRLHLSFDHHCDPLHYLRSRVGFLTEPPTALTPEDFEPAGPMLEDPSLEALVTYPRFLTDSKGELTFLYRIGKSGDGDHFLQRYHPDTGTWTRDGMLLSHRGTYGPWKESTSRSAYFQDLLHDDRDRLHAIWTFREVSSTWASNHDLLYATSDDGGLTWQNDAGRTVADLAAGDPLELADEGLVVVDLPVHSWLMNAGPLGFDSKNRPHVVTFKTREVQPPQLVLEHDPDETVRAQLCFFHYWRDDDGTFHESAPILPDEQGTVRGDLLFDAHDDLFFYYPTPAGFRYYFAKAKDHWSHFDGPHPLTDPSFAAPQRNSSKHDRGRWRNEGVLSFTVEPKGGGFAILDLRLHGR